MNPKIRNLKINNYKKKLKELYENLEVSEIYGPGENNELNLLAKKAHNESNGMLYHFPTYDKDKNVENEISAIYAGALKLFNEKLSIFNNCREVIFLAEYNNEYFRIKCNAKLFLNTFPSIECISRYPFVIDDNYSIIVSIMKLEYEIEICVLNLT